MALWDAETARQWCVSGGLSTWWSTRTDDERERESCQGGRVGLIALTSLMQWGCTFFLNYGGFGGRKELESHTLCRHIDNVTSIHFPNKKEDPPHTHTFQLYSILVFSICCRQSMPSQVFTALLFVPILGFVKNGANCPAPAWSLCVLDECQFECPEGWKKEVGTPLCTSVVVQHLASDKFKRIGN